MTPFGSQEIWGEKQRVAFQIPDKNHSSQPNTTIRLIKATIQIPSTKHSNSFSSAQPTTNTDQEVSSILAQQSNTAHQNIKNPKIKIQTDHPENKNNNNKNQIKTDPTNQALLNQTSSNQLYHVALLLEELGLRFRLRSFDPLSSGGGFGRIGFFLLSWLSPNFSLHCLRWIIERELGFGDMEKREGRKFEENILWAVCEKMQGLGVRGRHA